MLRHISDSTFGCFMDEEAGLLNFRLSIPPPSTFLRHHLLVVVEDVLPIDIYFK